MLSIIYDNISVTPMRSEYPEKSFSSEDVPHGTNSVYLKSASILVNSGLKNISLPAFNQEEKDSMIASRISSLSEVDELSNPDASALDQTEVLNPTTEEITVEFAKKDNHGESIYENSNAAKNALINARKLELATEYVKERIRQFLDVPTLSDEWKAQFTTTESE